MKVETTEGTKLDLDPCPCCGHKYTLSQAMRLAKAEKYHPNPPPVDAPELSVAEALRVIKSSLAASSFNWLTGQAARDVLELRLRT